VIKEKFSSGEVMMKKKRSPPSILFSHTLFKRSEIHPTVPGPHEGRDRALVEKVCRRSET